MNKLNKKGQLGLDTAKLFVIGILIIGIISFITVILMGYMGDAAGNDVSHSGSLLNSSFTLSNATAGANTSATLVGLESVVLSNVRLYNGSSGELINAANYTVSGAYFTAVPLNGAGNIYHNRIVNLSADYTYVTASDARDIRDNVMSGTASLFGSVGTWFALLAVVIIIMIVTIVIISVSRFNTKSSL